MSLVKSCPQCGKVIIIVNDSKNRHCSHNCYLKTWRQEKKAKEQAEALALKLRVEEIRIASELMAEDAAKEAVEFKRRIQERLEAYQAKEASQEGAE